LAEKKGRGKIAAMAEEIVRSAIENAGYTLWDVDYYKEGADYNLLITIEHPDRERAIDLDDCERVSRLISPLLDEQDPTDDPYYLEVSSAGLERELRRPEHFSYYLSCPVRVRLYAPRDGVKTLEGRLKSYSEGDLVLLVGEKEISLKKEAVAKVTTVFEDSETQDI